MSLDCGGCFTFLFGTGRQDGLELLWSNWQLNTPFDEDELLNPRELARGGVKKI
jgi:hypothetical protein